MSIWNYFLRGLGTEGTMPVARQNARQKNRIDISFRLADKILQLQQLVATFLNTKTKGISKQKMWLLLIGFIILGGMYCLYLILSAVLIFLQ